MLKFFKADFTVSHQIPLFLSVIKAGFPSPAEDFCDGVIDLNREFIRNPATTFYARADGDSLKDIGIYSGDLLIIDRSIKPTEGKLAVCYIDGEFTAKEIHYDKDCLWLIPHNRNFQPIKITKENDFLIWGMIIHVIKSF